jgi:hypothetical protein
MKNERISAGPRVSRLSQPKDSKQGKVLRVDTEMVFVNATVTDPTIITGLSPCY